MDLQVTKEAMGQRTAMDSKKTDLLQLMINAHNLDLGEEQKAEAKEFGVSYENHPKEKGKLCSLSSVY